MNQEYPYSIFKQRGFTLIQTMVVLGLIGILIAVITNYFAK